MAIDPLTRIRQYQGISPVKSDTTSEAIANNAQSIEAQRQQIEDYLASAERASQESVQESPSFNFSTPEAGQSTQSTVMPGGVPITQAFGNYNPSVEVFNKSGINTGTDFGVKEGTPIALPAGEWQVVDSYSGASGRGSIGNKTNKGYGNSVLVMNTKTGETLRYSHLSGVRVQPGQRLSGGTVIGASGATGNVTGPHLDLEYRTGAGKLSDVLKSPYAQSLFGQATGGSTLGQGGGNPLTMIGDKVKSLFANVKPVREQIAEIQAMTPQQMQDQAFKLVTAGTVAPVSKGAALAKEIPTLQSLKLGAYNLEKLPVSKQMTVLQRADEFAKQLIPKAIKSKELQMLSTRDPKAYLDLVLKLITDKIAGVT